jgi:outer membrane receptor protein involved in Fe transport
MRSRSLFNKRLLPVFLAAASIALPQAAPPQPTGTITGSVYDGQTGRPILGVAISVDGVADPKNATNSDGRFTISASPGNHALKFTADTYQPVDIREVVVVSGEVVEASTLMTNQRLVTSIDVVEKLDAVTSTSEVMLMERKLSAVVSDSIGHQELSESTAGDAAAALEKVTGVSVVGDGFVYVRGLGERYSATQLNGAVIPTTEPEKRVVPLDLFPSAMLDNIKIAKTYSADLPGEFSGGLVQIQTTEFPSKAHLSVSYKAGFNTVTTNSPFQTYPSGGGLDFFGFGSASKGIPSIIGPDQRLFQGSVPPDQLQTYGRSFKDIWESEPISNVRPANDVSINGGSTWGKFGLVSALTFANKPTFHREVQRYIRQNGGTPYIFTEYPDFQENTENARLGGVVNAAYRFSPNHKLLFKNTYTHDTDKNARLFSGSDGGTGIDLQSERLRYVERSLYSTGVEGNHSFVNLHNSLVHWQFTYSNSQRKEPDIREVFRGKLPNGTYVFAALGSSAVRFFSDLNDHIYEPTADYSIPFFKGSVTGLFKTGFRATIRRRDFQARRFRFIPQRLSTLDLTLPSNQLLAPENIRPDGFQLVEFTRGTDSYTASGDIYAGYAMVDLNFGSKWRLSGGVRIEDADQNVLTIDNRVPGSVPVTASLQNRDPIPAINLIYAATQKQNLRVSYSRTVSRPDFRELSPFDFNNVLGGFVTVGNANLKRAIIDNYDFRWELFPGANQLFAASFFMKKFHSPIESTILPSNDLRQSFINAKGARNFGIELEARQDLGRLWSSLKEFSLTSNFTMVDSNIEIKPEDALILTSKSRPLLGQSRILYNGAVHWARPKWHSDASLFGGYVSRRITDVGTFNLPDIYQEATPNLDFVYQYTRGERGQWVYRVEGENLTNTDFRWTQGPFTQRQYVLGRTFQVGLTYSFF